MTDRVVEIEIEASLFRRLEEIAEVDDRTSTSVAAMALKSFLDLTPSARRILFSMDDIGEKNEKKFVAEIASRSILNAYRTILESPYLKNISENHPLSRMDGPLTEEIIEKDAIHACFDVIGNSRYQPYKG